jgi:hypothetical protein
MTKIALATINTFVPHATQGPIVPPSDRLITLTSDQLQDIIKEAIQPLQDRIESLEARIIAQDEKIASLESTQEQDTNRICVDIAYDRQRLVKLEQRPPTITMPRGEKTIARVAKIDEVLKARGPTTLKELRRIVGVDRATMTRLLSALDMRRYEIHTRPGDDREKVLRLKVQIG